jgi:hypothetical protein
MLLAELGLPHEFGDRLCDFVALFSPHTDTLDLAIRESVLIDTTECHVEVVLSTEL